MDHYFEVNSIKAVSHYADNPEFSGKQITEIYPKQYIASYKDYWFFVVPNEDSTYLHIIVCDKNTGEIL